MARTRAYLAGGAVLLALVASPHAAPIQSSAAAPELAVLSKPILFEANRGQANARTEFVARGPGYTIALASANARLSLGAAADTIGLVFVGTSQPKPMPLEPQNARVHYYGGSDPSRWLRDVPVFGRVKYADTYPGVDVIYYGKHGELEFDIDMAPGADPSPVRMRIENADAVRIDADGALQIARGTKEIRIDPPTVYQQMDGSRVPVSAAYLLDPNGDFRIELGPYDPARRVTIDPVLVYPTVMPTVTVPHDRDR